MHELTAEQSATIDAAIKAAERQTTATIHVFISHRVSLNPLTDAMAEFHERRLDRSTQRNAVLLFVAPASHTFALYGDAGIHHRVGEEAWGSVVDEMKPLFRSTHLAGAIEHGVGRVGELLAKHFPRRGAEG